MQQWPYQAQIQSSAIWIDLSSFEYRHHYYGSDTTMACTFSVQAIVVSVKTIVDYGLTTALLTIFCHIGIVGIPLRIILVI